MATWREDVEARLEELADGPALPIDDKRLWEAAAFVMVWQWALEDFDKSAAKGLAQPDRFSGLFC